VFVLFDIFGGVSVGFAGDATARFPFCRRFFSCTHPVLFNQRDQSLDLAVAILEPVGRPDSMDRPPTSFEDLLGRSDFVSVHAPLLPATRGLMNAAAFARMKKGAFLVNTARGPLVDETALVAALDSGHLGGAALDVVTVEPLAGDSPLLGRDNVILTPHTAFYSVEALEELQTKCASDVARVLSGEAPVYPVKTA